MFTRKRILSVLLMLIILGSSMAANTSSVSATTTKDTTTTDTKANDSSTASGVSSLTVSAKKGPSVVAESAIIMEASTGMVLYSKNINDKHYPASITKIMTALLALENCSLSETVTFSHDAVFGLEPGSAHISADVDEQLTMEQCLYALMLKSANEVANAIGEHVAGSVEKFADMMNAKAKELGCKNTHFTNPHGLHNPEHYTTAYDMALITRAAMKNQTYRTIAGTKRYIIPPTNKQTETRYLTNKHQMIYPNDYPQYAYQYTLTGKTGYTDQAGNTLVTVAKKDGLELICVVLKSKPSYCQKNQYTDTISLLDYCFANFSVYNINEQSTAPTIDENQLFTKYNCLYDSTQSPLKIEGDNTVVIPNTADVKDVVQTINYYKDVKIQEGDNVIGSITYTLDGTTVGKNNIIYTKMSNRQVLENSIVVQKNTNKPLANIFSLEEGVSLPTILIVLGLVLFIILVLIIFLMLIKKHRSRAPENRYSTKKSTKFYSSLHDMFNK